MHPTLFVDAFGRLVPIPERVAPEPESHMETKDHLWGTFRNRSEHMRWSAREGTKPSRLWKVEEAELTYHLESSRIGFAQIGLHVNPATVVMPLGWRFTRGHRRAWICLRRDHLDYQCLTTQAHLRTLRWRSHH